MPYSLASVGAPITASMYNELARSRRSFTFANAAARTAETAMVVGDTAYQTDTGVEYIYTSTGWFGAPGAFGYFQGTVTAATGVASNVSVINSRTIANNVTVGADSMTVAVTGWYELTGTVSWPNNATGARVVDITLNAADMTYPLGLRQTASATTRQTLSGVRHLTSGGVLRLRVLQDSGSSLLATSTLSAKFLSTAAAAV